MTALSTVYQWFPLGIYLGLSPSDLNTIEAEHLDHVERCRIEMLDMWLRGPEEKRSKQFLQYALQQLPLSLPSNTTAGRRMSVFMGMAKQTEYL